MAHVWRRIPGILAGALLAWQMAMPWTVTHYVTQDGPSHVYNAGVARGLVFDHHHSLYAPLYTIQRAVVPNWMDTLLLAGITRVAGPLHAEALFASVALLVGFLTTAYAGRALLPEQPSWTPVANAIFQSWFLWLGFYNFYLGMALVPFAIGYFMQHAERMTARTCVALGAMLLVLFTTHLVAAGVAVVVIVVMALWMRPRGRWLAIAAAAPVMVLAAWYAISQEAPGHYDPQAGWAWSQFPMHILSTGRGAAGHQEILRTVLLVYMGAAALTLTKKEWRSAQGGLVLAALVVFALYLFVPDRALGGGQAKIRLAWAVFVLGGLLVCSTSRLLVLRVPVSLGVAALLAAALVDTAATARNVSRAAEEYLATTARIPVGSALVRLRYATPNAPSLYQYEGIGRDPLVHMDALAAAQCGCVDLSDYEAPTKTFPVVYKERVESGYQSALSALEGPDSGSVEALAWVRRGLPAAIDYAIVVGDLQSPEAQRQGMPAMLAYLGNNGVLVTQGLHGMVRVYQLTGHVL